MTQQQIKDMQTRIGVVPDGFWGPRSIAACKAHLMRMMPKPNPWPATDQRSLQRFYGSPGDESRLVNISVNGLGMQYEGASVRFVRCNGKVAVSLLAILKELSASRWAYVLKEYEGCYNNRPMRGGSLPSLHARGAAIDFCAATNGNQTAWPTRATMPLEVMEIFARHGWVAAGAHWGRDGMHFQATRP
jgi:hypothetical protein